MRFFDRIKLRYVLNKGYSDLPSDMNPISLRMVNRRYPNAYGVVYVCRRSSDGHVLRERGFSSDIHNDHNLIFTSIDNVEIKKTVPMYFEKVLLDHKSLIYMSDFD